MMLVQLRTYATPLLIFAAILAAALVPIYLNFSRPINHQSVNQCSNALIAAESQIERGRNITVRLIQTDLSTFKRYVYPAGLPIRYIYQMRGPDSVYILNSPEFSSIISKNIINACVQVGSVSFSIEQTPGQRTYGLVDNTVKSFRCVEATTAAFPLPWGDEACNF